ncbi:MAG TPA: YdbL family protein [Candidatus Omnitrophota bacterium]|nr:YdbL family protein [Candidatus Omnitrophota bacterium]
MRKLFIIACLLMLNVFSLPPVAYAQYDLKEITPAVQQALDNRRGRFETLNALKAKGVIGENNSGYIEALDASDPEAVRIVTAENQDRQVIYTAVAEQNGIMDEMKTIEKVFASVQREKAKTGEKIQLEDGQWSTK